MTANKLKLNDEKSELVMFTSQRMHSKIQDHSIQIADANIQSAHSARNLGIVLDENMTMAEQVKKICQSAYFQIRNISSISFCLMTLLQYLFMHLLPPDLTMEMHSCMEFQILFLINFNERKTQPLEYFQKLANMIT